MILDISDQEREYPKVGLCVSGMKNGRIVYYGCVQLSEYEGKFLSTPHEREEEANADAQNFVNKLKERRMS